MFVDLVGEIKTATVYVRTPELASKALKELGRVKYKGLRLAPLACASKDSIILLRPIDPRATQSEVLQMVQYLVGSDSVEHLSLEKENSDSGSGSSGDKTGICAIIVFRNKEATERAMKQLQGRTLLGHPLIVEHVVVPKKNRTTAVPEVSDAEVVATPPTRPAVVVQTEVKRPTISSTIDGMLRTVVEKLSNSLRSLVRW